MKDGKKVVCVSGYFNPLHIGHISLFARAKELGDYLVVVVNSDHQVDLKGSIPFMKEDERAAIISNLRMVDEVVISIDMDKTVCKTLEKVHPDVFANGGDRKSESDIPEKEVCDRLGIDMVFGVGGNEKQQASSELIKNAACCFQRKNSN
ncbi:MAG: adenylyltransferase/cytidyltransferase family protein [Candidatus Pacebacteria bacterium]|nr:adenylyltransferase/cytidyltransferase family protein [Candidatus Paceibacterota bacterium]